MKEKQVSQEFRLKDIYLKMNWWVESTKGKVCITLSYIEHFLILASAVTGCILISAFAPLLSISIGFTCSAIRFKICTIAAGIKKHESMRKRKRSMIKQNC